MRLNKTAAFFLMLCIAILTVMLISCNGSENTAINTPTAKATATQTPASTGETAKVTETAKETETVKPTGCVHQIFEDIAIEPTCTEPGRTSGSHCVLCNKIFKECTVIPPKDHTGVAKEAVSPTCTVKGTTKGIVCSECNTILSGVESISPLGHNVVNSLCTVCGKTESKGLAFTDNASGCSLSGIGSCSDSDIIIPEAVCGKTVNQISANALSGSDVVSIYIPPCVEEIDKGALSGLSALEFIDISFTGNSKTGDKSSYFGYIFGDDEYSGSTPASECTYIIGMVDYFETVNYEGYVPDIKKTYYIPATLKSVRLRGDRIAESAFSLCDKLETVDLSDCNATTIEKYAFGGCSSIISVNFSDSIQSFKTLSFVWCGLKHIEFPTNCNEIETLSFAHCNRLRSIKFNDNIETIGDYAFQNSVAIAEADFGSSSIENLGKMIFILNPSGPGVPLLTCNFDTLDGLFEIDAPTVASSIFISRSGSFTIGGEPLELLIIPDYVKQLDTYIFYGAGGIKSLVISETVESLSGPIFGSMSDLCDVFVYDENVNDKFIKSHFVSSSNTKFHARGEWTLINGIPQVIEPAIQ